MMARYSRKLLEEISDAKSDGLMAGKPHLLGTVGESFGWDKSKTWPARGQKTEEKRR
jgi:hypothetical protein